MAGFKVQSGDVHVDTDRFCRQPCDEPCTASDVENTESAPQRGKLHDTRAPRAEHGRHQLALIDLSRVARDLPWFALRHALDAATLRRADGSPARRWAAPHMSAT
jgi:hypothetical protein